MSRYVISNALGLIGAIAGGVLGFYTFQWLLGQSFYGLIIPGAFLGLGCSLLARHPSRARGIVCALAALGLGLYTEWHFFPFAADDSFSYFVKNLGSLKPVTIFMSAVGALVAFWLGSDSGFSGLGSRRGRMQTSSDPGSREGG